MVSRRLFAILSVFTCVCVLFSACGLQKDNEETTSETSAPVYEQVMSYAKNNLDMETCTLKSMITADGSIIGNNYSMVTDFIPLDRDTIIACFYGTTDISYGTIYSFALYDAEKELLDAKNFVSQSKNKVNLLPVCVSDGTQYIRLTIDNRYNTSDYYQLVFDYDGSMPTQYEEYAEPTVIERIAEERYRYPNLSIEKELVDIQGDVSQGCTYMDDGKFVMALPNYKQFAVYDTQTGEIEYYNWENDYGHTNDLCYNPNTGKLYAVAAQNCAVNVFSVENDMAFEQTILIDNKDEVIEGYVAGICYDRENDFFYVYYNSDYSSDIYVYDGAFCLIKKFERPAFETRYATQGMETDGKFIYRVQHLNEEIGFIYIYDASDGELVHVLAIFNQGYEIQDLMYDWNGEYYISTGDYSYHGYIVKLDGDK